MDNPWLALPFVTLYAFPWLFQRPSLPELVTAAIVLPLFGLVFVIGNRAPARYGFVCAITMGLLGMVAAPMTLTAAVLFIFAAALIGRASAGRLALYRLGILTAGVAVFGLWIHAVLWQWLPVVFLCGLVGYYCQAGAALHGRNRWLVASRLEAERQAAQAERERMTRDLHDLLGRSLTLISVKAELAERLLAGDPSRAGHEIADIRSSAREALQEMRQVVSGGKSLSLRGEIGRARSLLGTLSIPVDAPDAVPQWPLAVDQTLAYVTREAVTNIVRHAGPCDVRIEVEDEGGRAWLVISDTGRGTGGEGNGMTGMRTRVEAVGGTFALSRDGGTRLEVSVPVEEGPA